ncbi:unnamed protein product [Peronospora belbahrii]|uniref:Chromosome segregation in meiosis protein 3 domain-containing protein n=1 Tax=Peronospora belbahrii TaxID=622444 RepID=A0AAU9LAJ7_9STRA|nr:unnamed protein product [Peronospora belbahrii]CAH0482939.1 unnamed protein product [Peronospora belbahrii]CAH0514411.1 unnamed protein product [Peronospora belbahrii]
MATQGWERDDEFAQRDNTNASTSTSMNATASQDGKEDVSLSGSVQKRRRNLLQESHLVSAEGFKKVHRTFPYQVGADVSGREVQALASLIKMYKQWAFDLYPGLHFEDFVDRTETLGKGHQVQGLMTELREMERMKFLEKKRHKEVDERDDEKGSKGSKVIL